MRCLQDTHHIPSAGLPFSCHRLSRVDLHIGDQCDNILKGITGLGLTLASTPKNTPKKITKETEVAQTFGSLQGNEKLFLKLRLSRKLEMQMIRDKQPNQSICFRAAFFDVT